MQGRPLARKIRYAIQGRCRSGNAIARARGLDAANAEAAGVSAWGSSLPRQTAIKHRECALEQIQGKPANGLIRRSNWSKKWAAIKPSIAALDPALSLRDNKEETRVGNADHRFNHWTAVRDGLMNAHADIFPQVPAIVKTLLMRSIK